jgi:hypothetical protein
VKRTLITAGAVMFALAALVVAGIASAGTTAARAATKVTVAMHDPGCHWFQVGSSYKKTLTVKGPVSLFNVDEAALIIKGAHGTVRDRVGGSVMLSQGVYHITMVKQAPDDNHLLLTVR